MINKIIKLLFLVILIIIGVIFVSDGFINKISQYISDIKNYSLTVWQQQEPSIKQDFGTQTAETIDELKKIFQNKWQIYWNKIISWIGDKLPKQFIPPPQQQSQGVDFSKKLKQLLSFEMKYSNG